MEFQVKMIVEQGVDKHILSNFSSMSFSDGQSLL